MEDKIYNIGYTMGVFDLLHSGHVDFLKLAKSRCNYLIVGICSDSLTQQLKNKNPIFSEIERLNIVSSIKYVDLAFIINHTDKLSVWKQHNFDVVFHGEKRARYRNHEMLSRKLLKPLGIDFIYFDRDYSISTTKYINYIKARK